MKSYYFAVDLGATNGRTIIVSSESEEIEMEEINRFPNPILEVGGYSFWDIYELYRHILEGLKIVASRKDCAISSIGIDTWGVDFVLLGKDGAFFRQPYSYRDQHTKGASERYFSRVSKNMIYSRTGIQIMDFNSLFQFDTLRRSKNSAWEAADKILFMPDALSYLLTGKMVTEYTIATTAQIVNAFTRRLDSEILATVGLTENNFGKFVYPGEVVGTLTEEVQRLTGLGAVPVIAVGGHDTASAVAAIPALNDSFAYLSSGTWSLMGIETRAPIINADAAAENFTNEGGVEGNIRFLKNICGMWLLESCRRIWGKVPYEQLLEEARVCLPFRSLVNPDDVSFANPENMVFAIQEFCSRHNQPVPQIRGQLVRCIFESLAFRYRQVMDKLCQLSPVRIDVIHIIGGGSCNAMLNQFTANATGKTVIAGPSEATAIGNVMVQAIASGQAADLAAMRKLVSKSISLTTYKPQEKETWEEAYAHYLEITE